MHLLEPAAAPAPPAVPPASPSPFHRQLILIMKGLCLYSSFMLERANLEVHLSIPSKATTTTSTASAISVHPVVFATPGKRV